MRHGTEAVIRTRGLSKAYGEVVALNALDLRVPPHSIFGFLGPNGAGKTTTMKLLLGLARPTGGTATIFGHDSVEESLAIRARIGYLPQQPTFPSHMSAREVLRFAARFFFSGPARAIETRIDEQLELVGLTQKADRPVKGFSGGERQRLGLAQAQINRPDLLILDEPAAALDPIGRHDVLAVMERLREYATIFYSTHILDDVQQVSDTVAILNRGELIAQGPIGALLAGDGQVVYSVTMKGDVDRARTRVTDESWVSQITVERRNGATTLQVGVSDQEAAEAHLLRILLAEESTVVTDFRRKTYELEDIFMDMVEGATHA